MRYEIIYVDPPWPYRFRSPKGAGRSAENHYPTMGLEAIRSLPVGDLAGKDCALFLWITLPLLPDAFPVMEAWGFKYSTAAFVWVKRNRKAKSYFQGMGFWTRSNAEICLLGIRGHPRRLSAAVQQIVDTPIGRHSAKPTVVRERIVDLLGDLPRIELFARERAPGWDAVGNEIDGRNIQEAIPQFARTAPLTGSPSHLPGTQALLREPSALPEGRRDE